MDLINTEEAKRVTENAIKKVAKGADPRWLALAEQAIFETAKRNEALDADDVHWKMAFLMLQPENEDVLAVNEEQEQRAWGVAWRSAVKQGWVSRRGTYVHSARVRCHRRLIPTYDSLIFWSDTLETT